MLGTAGPGGVSASIANEAGGGAGLGGAIFVNTGNLGHVDDGVLPYYMNGGSLIIQGGVVLSNGTTDPGLTGANSVPAASAAGSIFSTSQVGSTLNFQILSGQSSIVSDGIGDDSPTTLPGGSYVAGTGMGVALSKGGGGTLILGAPCTYPLATSLTGGTLQLNIADMVPAPFLETSGINSSTGSSLAINNAGAHIFATLFQGGGGLIKQGSGALILSGAPTYTGSTTVQNGTLQFGIFPVMSSNWVIDFPGIVDLTGVINPNIIDLQGNGTLNLGDASTTLTSNTPTTFTGTILGSINPLVKTGPEVWTFGGVTGPAMMPSVTISQGTIALQNGTLAGDVQVNAGAFLTGNGTVGSLNVQGTIAPGAGNTILSNAMMTIDGEYIAELSGGAGALVETPNNTITLGPMSSLIVQIGSSTPSQQKYTILRVSPLTVLSNPFPMVILPPNFPYLLKYLPEGMPFYIQLINPVRNDLPLSMQRLMNYFAQNEDILGTFYEQLFALPKEQLMASLRSIAPTNMSLIAQQRTTLAWLPILKTRLSEIRRQHKSLDSRVPTPKIAAIDEDENHNLLAVSSLCSETYRSKKRESAPDGSGMSVWVAPVGAMLEQKSKTALHSTFTANLVGGFLGVDSSGQNSLIGGGVGYTSVYLKQNNHDGSERMHNFYATLMGGYDWNCFYAQGALGATFQYSKNRRFENISGVEIDALNILPDFSVVAASNFWNYQLFPYIELGWYLPVTKVVFEPFFTTYGLCNFGSAISETGAAPFNFQEEPQVTGLLRAQTGLNLYTNMRTPESLSLKLSGSYIYQQVWNQGSIATALVPLPSVVVLSAIQQDHHFFAYELEIAKRTVGGFAFATAFYGEHSGHSNLYEISFKFGGEW